ncbi:Rid family hydrolase [Brucella grignonensis]|uniref:Endoribonuclease L-PSP family protein n=1 Tax=Brucella grignonensis TaxID=94627 RepID=A0A256F1P5_9HYPH|nr:Rid family hydrolase [Brucella grignonensis]OYR08341.1 endoribonuclease L-PSP family protein [Brucella grignonensis]
MSSVERLDAKSKTSELASYSRAVKVGDFIFVSGTLGRNSEGDIPNVGDAGGQTEIILQRIENALKEMNAGLDDVVETRIFVADIKKWEGVGVVHGKAFRKAMPATTLLQVSGFAHPEALVEISAIAYSPRS